MSLITRRLHNLGIGRQQFSAAEQVVSHLVAMQSQDYLGAAWGIGLRAARVGHEGVNRAFDAGSILRTHVLRPTWHFVLPEDIAWLLELTAPRVQAINGTMYRKLGLTEQILGRSDEVLAETLSGHRHMTREELKPVLAAAGLPVAAPMQLTYLMAHAELTRTIVSGPRKGKQLSYALFADRAKAARSLQRDEALAELARRYFASRGPANEHDLAKWAGLTLTDARKGLEAVRGELDSVETDSGRQWFAPGADPETAPSPTVHLLSIYDEYIASYRGWEQIVASDVGRALVALGNALTHVVLLDGRIVGSWRRDFRTSAVVIEVKLLERLADAELGAMAAAVDRYAAFFGVSAELRQG